MLSTLIGSLLGGIFRLIPEAMAWFDKKNERKHEKEMFSLQLEADKQRSENALREIQAQGQIVLDQAGLEALTAAIKGQAEQLKDSGSKLVNFINALNVSVRPVVTYCLVGLYALSKATMTILLAISLKDSGQDISNALLSSLSAMYNDDDRAILAAVLNFYFLGRIFDRKK